VRFVITATRPGYSDIVGQSSYVSDKIIAPGEMHHACWQMPKKYGIKVKIEMLPVSQIADLDWSVQITKVEW
jgi:hypothetical protein